MTNEDDDDDASDESSLTSVIEVIVKAVVSVYLMKLRYLPVLDSLYLYVSVQVVWLSSWDGFD